MWSFRGIMAPFCVCEFWVRACLLVVVVVCGGYGDGKRVNRVRAHLKNVNMSRIRIELSPAFSMDSLSTTVDSAWNRPHLMYICWLRSIAGRMEADFRERSARLMCLTNTFQTNG